MPMPGRAELESRLENPAFLLWFGRGYQQDSALEADLSTLRLAAAVVSSESYQVEQALRRHKLLAGQWPVFMASRDELQSWDRRGLPVLLLDKETRDSTPVLRRIERQTMFLDGLKTVVGLKPVVVGFGLDQEESEDLLEVVTNQDPRMPIILTGVTEELAVAVRRVATRCRLSEVFTKPEAAWSSLKDDLKAQGRLVTTDPASAVAIRIGSQRVALNDVFDLDPAYRIDHTWRIITSQATATTGQDLNINELFRAFMRIDEKRDAHRVEDDIKEWRAIAASVPFPRRGFDELQRQLLAALADTGPSNTKVAWLPVEPGSGATCLLHMLAWEAAKEGHPTLVLKQMAKGAKPEPVGDFLFALNRRLNARPPAALIVVDVDHSWANQLERLPEHLGLQRNLPALVLWAARIPFSSRVDLEGGQKVRARITQGVVESLRDRAVKDEDYVFQPLRATIDANEVTALHKHMERLRLQGLRVVERDPYSFEVFRKESRDHRRTLEADSGSASTDLDDLFWMLLYHFVTTIGDPLAEAMRRRIERFMDPQRSVGFRGGPSAVLLLAEIAKVGQLGTDIPQSALHHWLQAQPRQVSAAAEAPPAAPAVSGAFDLAQRLKLAWAGGAAAPPADPSTSMLIYLRSLIDEAGSEGLVEVSDASGATHVVFRHRILAQLFLRGLLLGGHSWLTDTARAEIGAALVSSQRHLAFKSLLSSLRPSSANLAFAEKLSELCLMGDLDDWSGRQLSDGEGRLEIYDSMPQDLRHQSRVLQHHHALVLRRTTFAPGLSTEAQMERLKRALGLLEAALEMPWARGQRDEHPAHLQTTIGWVYETLARVDANDRLKYRREARRALRDAVTQLPNARPTRFALARLLFNDAKDATDTGDVEGAVPIVAECLRMLSVPPTGRIRDWHRVRVEAAKLMSDEQGQRLVKRLKAEGIEDGFLLEAELLLSREPPARDEAVSLLDSCLSEPQILRRPRAARRYLELAPAFVGLRPLLERQRKLLTSVEVGLRLTPSEEYHNAVLDFQLGDYEAGRRRFRKLRESQRAFDVDSSEVHFLVDDSGKPRKLNGVVEFLEPTYGQMRIVDPSTGSRLFVNRFQIMHFARDGAPTKGRQYQVFIRMQPMGPLAVPIRFVTS